MTPAEWVAAARQAWRVRATATEHKLRMDLPDVPRITSVQEARAISMHFIHTIRRPTLDDALILLSLIDDLLWEQEASGANILRKQLSERTAQAVRADLEAQEARIELKQAKVALAAALQHGAKVIAENAGLQVQLAMLTDRHARLIDQMMDRQERKEGAREVAATRISRRRAEALLNHLAAGGPEGTNARLRLLEALCGERT